MESFIAIGLSAEVIDHFIGQALKADDERRRQYALGLEIER
jgi:hypothetical protein